MLSGATALRVTNRRLLATVRTLSSTSQHQIIATTTNATVLQEPVNGFGMNQYCVVCKTTGKVVMVMGVCVCV
jgi:hypothetical protein